MEETKKTNQFPRSDKLPTQSPRYWVKEKDRYIRQLLISDIESSTQRELIVCFARLDQSIVSTDADDLSEVLEGVRGDAIDIMLHTAGGYVEAVEKFVTVLKYLKPDYRVIIPNWAKSGGTLIALASKGILLGVNSELGPVDPQIELPQYGIVPAGYVANDDTQPRIYSQIAKDMFERAKILAKKYLQEGMLHGQDSLITNVLEKLSSPGGYGSHGAVIDYNEANLLGLRVEWVPPDSDMWKRIWLLYCLYDADTQRDNIGKIFEGSRYSISRKPEA